MVRRLLERIASGIGLRTVATVALVVVLASAGAGPALATPGQDGGEDAGGGADVHVDEFTVQVSDFDLHGPGLPDRTVDHARYTVGDGTVTVGSFSVDHQGQTYSSDGLTVDVDGVGVVLSDVTLGDGDGQG